ADRPEQRDGGPQTAGARDALARIRAGIVAQGNRRVAWRDARERETAVVSRPTAPCGAAAIGRIRVVTVSECPREHEVVDAVASGRWPAHIGQDLRSHVDTCAICADVAVVAAAMQADRDRAWNDVQVP